MKRRRRRAVSFIQFSICAKEKCTEHRCRLLSCPIFEFSFAATDVVVVVDVFVHFFNYLFVSSTSTRYSASMAREEMQRL